MSTKKNARKALEEEIGPLTFGMMIKSIRLADDISQSDMAKKLGISKQHLCDLEKERKAVSIERAAFFAEKLEQPIELFVKVALQDQIKQAGLDLEVTIQAS